MEPWLLMVIISINSCSALTSTPLITFKEYTSKVQCEQVAALINTAPYGATTQDQTADFVAQCVLKAPMLSSIR